MLRVCGLSRVSNRSSIVTSNEDSRNNGADHAFTAFIHEVGNTSIIRFLFARTIPAGFRAARPTFIAPNALETLRRGEPHDSALERSAVCHFTAD
jgi:hypothetical protein